MAQTGIFHQLLFVSALLLGLGNAEQLKISVQLSKSDDGEVGASLYIANASQQLFKDFALSLDIDAFIDSSKNLIGAGGYVKETRRNNEIQLTCEATSKDQEMKILKLSYEREISAKDEEMKSLLLKREKDISVRDEEYKRKLLLKEKEVFARDEEIKQLRLYFCSKDGEGLVNIFPGDDEGYERRIIRENRTQAADFLIVDAHSYVDSSKNIQKIHPYRKQWCNFWITDEGKALEGLGWTQFNYYYNGGLGSKSLIIGFVKKDKDTSPSAKAIKTFEELVKSAICLNKLSPRYTLIPYYLINDYNSLDTGSFEKSGMNKWMRYEDDLNLNVSDENLTRSMATGERKTKWKGDFGIQFLRDENSIRTIVPRGEWLNTSQSGGLKKISSPIKNILVRNYAARCFLDCGNFLRTIEVMKHIKYGIMNTNFWVAEDGKAYEFEGWEKTWVKEYQEKKVVVVTFMGSFNNYHPIRSMFEAFEALIEEGLSSEKLSPDYKIVPIRRADRGTIGESLRKEICQNPRYSEELQ